MLWGVNYIKKYMYELLYIFFCLISLISISGSVLFAGRLLDARPWLLVFNRISVKSTGLYYTIYCCWICLLGLHQISTGNNRKAYGWISCALNFLAFDVCTSSSKTRSFHLVAVCSFNQRAVTRAHFSSFLSLIYIYII